MSNVVRLRGVDPLAVLDTVREKHAVAYGVIVMVIDENGALWHYMDAKDSHLAWAAARLLHISGSDET